ncbi:D-glycero-D-manno-heptose 1-phosphate guanosyltransferase [Candidatus Methylopumilus universalis]|uniref:sugar phosphate nucleotidyltransferase n=1 Tax=Candidatus Methylopumilus universalis TaxID=2588536 RepID=UPI00111FB3B5|nr:sugar phosphate nucleotidyltransferase [Candidatus Methylopumilus universalis]QDC96498.1 D-glycero-D-manno-heptose 1-phosphate guanosyltransferase [Candidatus Methylopumilus universalis]
MLDILILAGGLGTRLRPVIEGIPKSMAPIGNLPFLEYILNFWSHKNISRFILSTGYKSEIIRDYFGRSYKDIQIDYVEEISPLGTGGAILHALRSIKLSPNLIIANGDTWFDVDLNIMFEDFDKYQKPYIVGLKPIELNTRFDGVSLDENGLITQFGENHITNKYINAGVYIVKSDVLLKFMKNFEGNFSFETVVLKQLAKQGNISASIQNKEFIDIGIPDDYKRAEKIILQR